MVTLTFFLFDHHSSNLVKIVKKKSIYVSPEVDSGWIQIQILSKNHKVSKEDSELLPNEMISFEHLLFMALCDFVIHKY